MHEICISIYFNILRYISITQIPRILGKNSWKVISHNPQKISDENIKLTANYSHVI